MAEVSAAGGGAFLQELALLQEAIDGQDKELAKLRSREKELALQLRNHKNLEMEVEELRKTNKELELENRRQAFHFQKQEQAQAQKGNSAFSRGVNDLSGFAQNELKKVKELNTDLTNQVRTLQQSRFNEVEELVYLRWVNACLRFELKNGGGGRGAAELSSRMSPRSQAMAQRLLAEYDKGGRMGAGGDGTEAASAKKRGLMSKFFGRGEARSPPGKARRAGDQTSPGSSRRELHLGGAQGRGQGGSGAVGQVVTSAMQHGPKAAGKGRDFKLPGGKPVNRGNLEEAIDQVELTRICNFKSPDVKRRPTRTPRTPPLRRAGRKRKEKKAPPAGPGLIPGAIPGAPPLPPPLPGAAPGAPPPPPPMPGMGSMSMAPGAMMGMSTLGMMRAPEVIKLYQMMMKRDGEHVVKDGKEAKRDPTKEMVSELNGRSAHLIAIQQDIEDQKDFVETLAAEVRECEVVDMEDVVEVVEWLDEELDFLVDEHAVLKHFKHLWPEAKADTLREAACEYGELVALEREARECEDDPSLGCEAVCKKIFAQMDRVEQKVYLMLRTREGFVRRMQEHKVPHEWVLDTGMVGQVKLATVQMARHFMRRVSAEVQRLTDPDDEPQREYLLLEGVRFAFRVHQFAGGFDAESMKVFMDLHEQAMSNSKPQAAGA